MKEIDILDSNKSKNGYILQRLYLYLKDKNIVFKNNKELINSKINILEFIIQEPIQKPIEEQQQEPIEEQQQEPIEEQQQESIEEQQQEPIEEQQQESIQEQKQEEQHEQELIEEIIFK